MLNTNKLHYPKEKKYFRAIFTNYAPLEDNQDFLQKSSKETNSNISTF